MIIFNTKKHIYIFNGCIIKKNKINNTQYVVLGKRYKNLDNKKIKLIFISRYL